VRSTRTRARPPPERCIESIVVSGEVLANYNRQFGLGTIHWKLAAGSLRRFGTVPRLLRFIVRRTNRPCSRLIMQFSCSFQCSTLRSYGANGPLGILNKTTHLPFDEGALFPTILSAKRTLCFQRFSTCVDCARSSTSSAIVHGNGKKREYRQAENREMLQNKC
jgi:hypothetical protein